MKRVEIKLSDEERAVSQTLCTARECKVRQLNRAQILLALDQGIKDQNIAQVLGVERTRIWRTRKNYLEHGLAAALHERPRPGRPAEYDLTAQAELVALACSNPPKGQQRWTLALLSEVARQQSRLLQAVSQETVRKVLKKTNVSLG